MAKAEITADPLLLLLLLLPLLLPLLMEVEKPIVVAPVGLVVVESEAVVSVPVGLVSAKAAVAAESVTERDVLVVDDESGMEPEDIGVELRDAEAEAELEDTEAELEGARMELDDAGSDELPEAGGVILVMAKAGLLSPESPNKTTR